MPPPKPAVLVTRRMPSVVLGQLDAVCEIDLHTEPDNPCRATEGCHCLGASAGLP